MGDGPAKERSKGFEAKLASGGRRLLRSRELTPIGQRTAMPREGETERKKPMFSTGMKNPPAKPGERRERSRWGSGRFAFILVSKKRQTGSLVGRTLGGKGEGWAGSRLKKDLNPSSFGGKIEGAS